MNTHTHTVLVVKENGNYRALCPALPRCTAHGNTRKEALQNIEISILHRLEVLKKKGEPIPKDKDLV